MYAIIEKLLCLIPLLEDQMKPNYYFITFLFFILIISMLNFLVELNAYTPNHAENSISVMKQTTEDFKVVDYPISLITLEERCVDEQNQQVKCHQLQDIQNGDILITKSNHTLLYRHGHAGIVVDAEAGLVLEALGYGTSSRLESLEKWDYYPTVKVLRLKNRTEETITELVERAMSDFLDINYNLIATKTNMNLTHCSDIVWKVFNAIGVDIDSNGGWLVTPKDISQSQYLYEVESYGFSAERPW